MGRRNWTPGRWIAAAVAFSLWWGSVAAARFLIDGCATAPDTAPRSASAPGTRHPPPAAARGVASSPGLGAAEADRRIAACEAAWRDWTLRREDVPLRDVTFRVVADEEFRARVGAGWEDDVRARMAKASAVFEREFRVRFVVGSVGEWTSDDAAATIHELHAALARQAASAREDVVIGFTSQHGPARPGPRLDVYDRGVAYYYGRCCIVRAGLPAGAGAWPYEDETVLHEVGHLFGAWHSTDGRSVMRALKDGPQRAAFDAYARTAILAARDVDFRRGTDSVGDAEVDSLYSVWKVSHPADADFPPWQALCTEGWWARDCGRADDASRRCARALALDRRLGPFGRTADVRDLLAWAAARNPR
jgi:hypothetical protein